MLTHELAVLLLPPGQVLGSRTPGADGKVDESGSLGETSASCAAGAGDGISPGSASWVTLNLRAGRYELLCNLPGHYIAELDVTCLHPPTTANTAPAPTPSATVQAAAVTAAPKAHGRTRASGVGAVAVSAARNAGAIQRR